MTSQYSPRSHGLPEPAGSVASEPAAWSLLPVGASATGVGSLPGVDIREATSIVFGECDVPYLPELPARGPGADLVGRTVARLAHIDPAFSVTTTPSGWRLTDRPGRDVRRALSWWGEDLDALEERAAGYVGPLKVQLAGPFTVAANVELVSGEKVLRDSGARRDLAAATALAGAELVAEVRARIPGAKVVVQLDEPSLASVIAGTIKTASGLTSYRPVEPVEAEALLSTIVAGLHNADAKVVMHACAPFHPYELWHRVAVDGISLDVTLLVESEFDSLGACLDRGTALLLGVVPTSGTPDADAALARVTRLQRELSFDDDAWLPNIAITPTCGLASLSPAVARATIDTVHSVSRSLRGATNASESQER